MNVILAGCINSLHVAVPANISEVDFSTFTTTSFSLKRRAVNGGVLAWGAVTLRCMGAVGRGTAWTLGAQAGALGCFISAKG